MTTGMTDKRWAVLCYLVSRYNDKWANEWATPTEIGRARGKPHSWASDALRWLVAVGYVTRHKHYPEYSATCHGVLRWKEGR